MYCDVFQYKRCLIRHILLLAIIILSACKKETTFRVKSETIKVDSLDQIVLISDSLVKPILYTHIEGLKYLPVRRAKKKFISAILPSILVAKHEIEEQKRKLTILKEKKKWKPRDSVFYKEMLVRYKAEHVEEILARIGTIPNSIVLAQAALESGWGQSRFFLEGNNLFGIWSFNHYEPRIEAGMTRGKKRIYLRAYADPSEAIEHYFQILSSARPYKSLRLARLETDDPFELLPHLKNFSERREAYTNQLKKMIEVNHFTQYDHYKIDPTYIIEEEID